MRVTLTQYGAATPGREHRGGRGAARRGPILEGGALGGGDRHERIRCTAGRGVAEHDPGLGVRVDGVRRGVTSASPVHPRRDRRVARDVLEREEELVGVVVDVGARGGDGLGVGDPSRRCAILRSCPWWRPATACAPDVHCMPGGLRARPAVEASPWRWRRVRADGQTDHGDERKLVKTTDRPPGSRSSRRWTSNPMNVLRVRISRNQTGQRRRGDVRHVVVPPGRRALLDGRAGRRLPEEHVRGVGRGGLADHQPGLGVRIESCPGPGSGWSPW